MRTKLLTWIVFCLIFVGVGCSGNEPAVTPTATAVSQVTVPTETAVPPTATIEPTPVVTETAVSPPTPTPTPAPTLPPSPTGSVLFLWDSETFPYEGAERNHTLYLAQPGESATAWDVQPVLNDLFGFPILDVSPDNTKLMFTLIEDANGDGSATQEGVNRGGDGYVLYVYEFASGQSEKLPIGLYNPFNPAWLSDDESLNYRGSVTVYLIHTDGLPGQEIAVFPKPIKWIMPSPDGSLIAVNASGLTSFIKVATGELITITGEISGGGMEPIWSPDSQWLALHHRWTDQFFLINADTLDVSSVETTGAESYVTWSPDSQQLLLVEIEEDSSTLSFLDPHNLTISASKEISAPIFIQGASDVKSVFATVAGAVWSPDGTRIALAFSEQNVTKLAILDLFTMEITELWQRPDVAEIHMIGWSPDGGWILFTLQQATHRSELNILHWQGGEAYPIFVADETFPPQSIMWLAESTQP